MEPPTWQDWDLFGTKSHQISPNLTSSPRQLGQESLVLFDRAGGLPHIALQLPVPPKDTLPKEVGLDFTDWI